MASVKIQNVEFIELDNVKVTYVTGTEKIYQAGKLPKTVLAWIAAHQEETEPEPAAVETIETVETTEQDMEPTTIETIETATQETPEPETLETIPEEQEPENVPVLNLDGTRRTGGLIWDVTQYIVYPVAGLLLTAAAHIVGYLATVAYMLATFAGHVEPVYNRAVAAIRNAAHKVQIASVRAWNTAKEATPVILETVRAYTVQAMEFRADIIAQDKPVDEF